MSASACLCIENDVLATLDAHRWLLSVLHRRAVSRSSSAEHRVMHLEEQAVKKAYATRTTAQDLTPNVWVPNTRSYLGWRWPHFLLMPRQLLQSVVQSLGGSMHINHVRTTEVPISCNALVATSANNSLSHRNIPGGLLEFG